MPDRANRRPSDEYQRYNSHERHPAAYRHGADTDTDKRRRTPTVHRTYRQLWPSVHCLVHCCLRHLLAKPRRTPLYTVGQTGLNLPYTVVHRWTQRGPTTLRTLLDDVPLRTLLMIPASLGLFRPWATLEYTVVDRYVIGK